MNRNTEKFMETKSMNKEYKEYKEYIKECWKEAERVSIEVGSTHNDVVICFFDKIVKPFHYWLKEQR